MSCFPSGATAPEFTLVSGAATITPGNISVADGQSCLARTAARLPRVPDVNVALSYALAFTAAGRAGSIYLYGSASDEANVVAQSPTIQFQRDFVGGSHVVFWQVPGESASSAHSIGFFTAASFPIVLEWDRAAGQFSLTVNGITDVKASDPVAPCTGLQADLGTEPASLSASMTDMSLTVLEPVATANCCFDEPAEEPAERCGRVTNTSWNPAGL